MKVGSKLMPVSSQVCGRFYQHNLELFSNLLWGSFGVLDCCCCFLSPVVFIDVREMTVFTASWNLTVHCLYHYFHITPWLEIALSQWLFRCWELGIRSWWRLF